MTVYVVTEHYKGDESIVEIYYTRAAAEAHVIRVWGKPSCEWMRVTERTVRTEASVPVERGA